MSALLGIKFFESNYDPAKPKSRPRPTKADSQTELRALTHPEVRAIVLGIMLAMFLGPSTRQSSHPALPTIDGISAILRTCPGL